MRRFSGSASRAIVSMAIIAMAVVLASGPRTKAFSGSIAYLPNGQLTPGATLSVGQAEICKPGYAGQTRNVPASVKKSVYLEYGLTPGEAPCPCEVDHLISLELGGANDIKNLWPEPYHLNVNGFEMGAHEKDKAEDATHRAVCGGKISLEEAQKQIATDWTVLYRRFVAKQFPKYTGQ